MFIIGDGLEDNDGVHYLLAHALGATCRLLGIYFILNYQKKYSCRMTHAVFDIS